ncbi:hypothetical protein P691DRAFT_812520 [Macrolepiota fuliginosa MF-IS2]|uniref:Uncharacterized protein n=1 Tax=Macrolepiota fuliginosa MF-IS2 TaxID=1400762 RepID=A0A9P5XLW2_9AGAR|nr:hypothetical protein P691DRAFT_812520 [Macrolepiota fuliginosa MF-IS2]
MPYPYPHALCDSNRGYRHPFLFGIHYLGGIGDNPRTVTELAMSKYSALLRRQPEWWSRYQEESVRAEWRKLAALPSISRVRTPSTIAEVQLSEKQIEYVIDELDGYAALRDSANQCQVSCFERIWESDTLLSNSANDNLRHLLLKLEHLPTCTRSDDGSTLNLVDPMLHCLVYHRTLVFYSHKASRPLAPLPATDIYTSCPRFALLPADIFIDDSGKVKFLSYINNVQREDHSLLYNHLEACLEKFIPLFEHTLTDLHRNNPLPQRIPGPCKYTVWDEPDPPEHSDDEEGWSTYEREMRFWVMNRPIQLPDVPNTGYSGGLEDRRFVVTLRGRQLQVVVGTTETRLRPQGPGFPGIPWHVKGMRNERIVASGIHCLSANNISTTSIQFRMAVTYPRGFSAGDNGATLRTWGLSDGDACHQYIGGTPLRTGVSLVWPNIYQHKQTPFELVDPTREGHLTLLMFYLIDPDIQPVPSTSSVAPQQKGWIRAVLEKALTPRLPMELVHEIFLRVEGLMDLQEAEDYRKAFIDIQTNFRQANNNYHFCIPFDIWNGPVT